MSSLATVPPRIPDPVRGVLDDFHRGQGGEVRCWLRTPAGWALAYATVPTPATAPGAESVAVAVPGAAELRVEVPGAGASAGFLASVLARVLRYDVEARSFGQEMSERYEEITLLYSISEILGSVISLEEAAGTILSEVVDTLGVQRAALWVHNPERAQLELVAAVGDREGQNGPVRLDDPASVTAEVFRGGRPLILEAGDEFPRGEGPAEPGRRGSFLSVPVSYTPPQGEARTIGVINLIGRAEGGTFSAGDQKLVSAIASQVGAAVENSRLVAESVRQERLEREMELAHDLQLKLLPPVDQFAGYAEIAARVVPAESVGGDFYHLFRLPGGRLGVMIGDVSSHGFGAALIMALTMSAVAIHASEGDAPREVLRRVHQALIHELESTEMYMTLFYGVIDPAAGALSYANAGHSHAYRITPGGEAHRLDVTDPPFGIVDLDHYGERSVPWAAGHDLLFLFTDGLSDALGLGEVEGERRLLDAAVRARHLAPERLMDRLFSLPAAAAPTAPPDDRTALLVRI